MRGQIAHLDPEVLAEFDAGLITGRRGAQISAHLAACERCATVGEQLAGVTALLTAAPAVTMPDRVAERLDTVLAAELARRDQNGSRRHEPRRAPRRQPRRRGARRLRLSLRPVALRVLAPAAAVALLVAGGYALSLGGSTSSSASSAANAPSSRSAAGAPAAARGSTAAGTSGRPSTGEIAAPLASTPPTNANRLAPAAFAVVTGAVDFAPGSFKQQVEAALRVPGNERRTTTSTTTIRACVQALAGSATPVLVESARYQGQPTTLVVARTGTSDTAWAAGSRCSATDHDVLDRTTVPSGISGP